jgi:hypothetical protein
MPSISRSERTASLQESPLPFGLFFHFTHAEGWIEEYEALEERRPFSGDLHSTVLANRNGLGESMLHWSGEISQDQGKSRASI